MLGWPALAVPVPGGGEGRLPASVQLVARPGREEQLLRAALVLEDELRG
ncbi:hypothetical protein [Micrococcus endophyticus]|uniref:Asp-tRNA(Asn)/Glu-tRNA(Gln) amidotransferase A subunit family amidase n=1 Tax=Micrococcus endophyticus TaxID=455343 RepID=A0A7W9JLE1_9MICC|nr:Asp-tRNA(Asn)/Glu-tRNA(Gln) amidotransferase A subunit family amidase [Micrococcus endophyticus]